MKRFYFLALLLTLMIPCSAMAGGNASAINAQK